MANRSEPPLSAFSDLRILENQNSHIPHIYSQASCTFAARNRDCPLVYTYEAHAHEAYAHKAHAYEMYVHEVHTREVYAYEIYIHEMHAYEIYTRGMHAHEGHAYKGYTVSR